MKHVRRSWKRWRRLGADRYRECERAREKESKKTGRPFCHECLRWLQWEAKPSRKGSRFATRRFYLRGVKTLAFRCLDCMQVFCAACARRHFLSMRRTYDRLDGLFATAMADLIDTAAEASKVALCGEKEPK